VLRAISLLRDDALRFNPESPRLYAELAYIFHHKIGLDFDEAGRDYRSRLAATFDVPAGSAAEASLLAEWKLDRDLSRRLAARLGVARLDFRAAGAHALYWAGRGLEVAGAGADPYDIRRLQILVLLSIRDLFEGGYPLRAGSKRSYAFVPHLECFDAAARELKRWVDEQAKDDEAGRREVLSAFFREALTYHFLFGRLEAARALLESSRDLLGANGKSLESLAMEGFLQADPNQVAAGDLLRALESCLESSLLLALAPEDPTRASLAEGFLSLARLLHGALRGRVTAAPPAGEKVGEFEEYLAAARLRRFEGKGKSEPGQLPWHLELLDPRQEAED
jgi:hypothetical protein